MSGIWLSRPGLAGGTILDYFDKWGMPYRLRANWDRIGRAGDSGLDAVLGVIGHHDAIPATVADTWAASIPPRWGGRRDDGPVGNGSLAHDGVVDLWAAGAANTAGKGGPLLGSRGVIPLDNGNRTTVSWEARNDGVGEPWTDAQVAAWPRLMAATLDWATHETPGAPLGAGDVWSHSDASRGWTNRKIDMAGPSPWGSVNRYGTWDMDLFRSDVHLLLNPPVPPVPEPDLEEDPVAFIAQAGNGDVWIGDALTSRRFTVAEVTDIVPLVIQAFQRAGRPLRDFTTGKEVRVGDTLAPVSDRVIRAMTSRTVTVAAVTV